MSFTLVVPAEQLYSRATFRAISKAHSTHRPVFITPDLFQELLHWRFLDAWTGFLPWRPEYITVSESSPTPLTPSGEVFSTFPATFMACGGMMNALPPLPYGRLDPC